MHVTKTNQGSENLSTSFERNSTPENALFHGENRYVFGFLPWFIKK